VNGGSFGDIDATAEALLIAFLEASSQGLFIVNTDGRVVSWNRGAARIFGHAAGEIVGQRFSKPFSAHLRPDIEHIIAEAVAGERLDRLPVEIQRNDGMAIPIALSLSPVVGSDGTVAGCAVVVDELTETRLAQAALAEVEARFLEWEAMAHVGRWLLDVATESVQWSDELHRMHGVEMLEFDGTRRAHLASLHPDDRHRIGALIDEAVTSGKPFADVYRVIHTNGEVHHLEVRADPTFSSSGTVVGLRGLSREYSPSSASASEESHSLEQI
jgi:two-component system, sensor histidine kinase and response regulator